MRIEELEKQIIEFIELRYKCKFIGQVEVHKDGNEYEMRLIMELWLTWTSLYNLCDNDELFLDFIKDLIIKRNLIQVDHLKLVLEDPEEIRVI